MENSKVIGIGVLNNWETFQDITAGMDDAARTAFIQSLNNTNCSNSFLFTLRRELQNPVTSEPHEQGKSEATRIKEEQKHERISLSKSIELFTKWFINDLPEASADRDLIRATNINHKFSYIATAAFNKHSSTESVIEAICAALENTLSSATEEYRIKLRCIIIDKLTRFMYEEAAPKHDEVASHLREKLLHSLTYSLVDTLSKSNPDISTYTWAMSSLLAASSTIENLDDQMRGLLERVAGELIYVYMQEGASLPLIKRTNILSTLSWFVLTSRNVNHQLSDEIIDMTVSSIPSPENLRLIESVKTLRNLANMLHNCLLLTEKKNPRLVTLLALILVCIEMKDTDKDKVPTKKFENQLKKEADLFSNVDLWDSIYAAKVSAHPSLAYATPVKAES